MKKLLIVAIYNLLNINLTAQSKLITTEICDNWKTLISGSCKISADGNNVIYKYMSKKEGEVAVFKSISNNYTIETKHATSSLLSNSNLYYIVLFSSDSLMIYDIVKKKKFFLDNIDVQIPISNYKNWILFHKNSPSEYVIRNIDTGEEILFENTQDILMKQGSIIFRVRNSLRWYDIDKCLLKKIDLESNIHDLTLNESGSQLAFIEDKSGSNSIITWDKDKPNSRCIYRYEADRLTLNLIGFEPNSDHRENKSNYLSIQVKKHNKTITLSHNESFTSDVHINSYRDHYYNFDKVESEQSFKTYKGTINTSNSYVNLVNIDSFQVIASTNDKKYSLVINKVNETEAYWRKPIRKLRLISSDSNNNIDIIETTSEIKLIKISPNNKHIVWYNSDNHEYFSFEINTRKTKNISHLIPETLFNSERGEGDKLANRDNPKGIACWLNNGKYLLIYDNNDIWKVDPYDIEPPINITQSYGKNHSIRYGVVLDNSNPINLKDSSILLWGFNMITKENGFWELNPYTTKGPLKLTMGKYAYYFQPRSLVLWRGDCDPTAFTPIKAKSSRTFIVRRMSFNEPPNLFYTHDFTIFFPISNINLENSSNWLTANLTSWKTSTGQPCDGIIYKPYNFDSSLKYPVIFNLYERKSDGLYVFKPPELSGHNINIPWFVSKGYIVIEPDIYYETGKTAQSIVDVFQALTEHLSTKKYINVNKLGIQGQSFGGYETNVLVSKTNIFAAACEMAGTTDLISEYGYTQFSSDRGQRNLNCFPWDCIDKFVTNSPIFDIENVNTPLLMIHNKNDDAILFSQAVEFFLGLRRLNKKVWLLQYDGEGHGINKYNNRLDFTLRLEQFFGYYLKNELPPIWLTKGIPSDSKNNFGGFSIDSTGSTP